MFRADSRPTGGWFRPHLLHVLGLFSKQEAFIGSDPEAVTVEVLKLAGIDPDNPPWPVKTRGDDPRRIVGFTFRNLRPQYKPQGFLTMLMDDGTWALTLQGARESATIDKAALPRYTTPPKAKPKKPKITVVVPRRAPQDCNLTAKWVREHGQKLYDKLERYLKPRFPTSHSQGLIEEHIQTFLTAFISRDSLRSRLERGEKVPLSQVCVYCRNSVNSQIRDNARRPLHRIMQGARTKQEREAQMAEGWTQQVFVRGGGFQTRGEDEEWVNPTESLVDESTLKTLDEKLAFDEGFSSFRAALRRRAPSQADDFASILEDRFVLEMTIKECAEKRGITRNQASSMLRTARSIVAREYERGSLSHDLGHA